MKNIQLLDCTLRDGGYCNGWRFGSEAMIKMIKGLLEADIEVIECGFITDRVIYDEDVTKFTTVEEASRFIPQDRKGKLFVAMINYGEYDMTVLPDRDGPSIDGIRLAFHKRDMDGALRACRQIKEKGYLVFVQAMVSLNYTDEEFLSLIKKTNEIMPYAFYIVDSFGMMKVKDLTRLFYLVEHNLHKDIWIGFHSHNNMQLAYSNAQTLVGMPSDHNLIVDSSVYGMGRGAGNLNTELLIGYLNENAGGRYKLRPLLTIIDEILDTFYQRERWGYSLPNYISAAHNAHPSYASYLDDKKTLTVEDMDKIFDRMDEEKKISYDRDYIEGLYHQYMATGKVQDSRLAELRTSLDGKTVVLIAPGKSAADEKERIQEALKDEQTVGISVNFDYVYADTDFIFLSDLRRYRDLGSDKKEKCIVTSNIPASDVYLQVRYRDLLNTVGAVHDNAGLMAIRFLISQGVKRILLAGFDGYSHDTEENYMERCLELANRNRALDAMNEGMHIVMLEMKKEVELSYLTTPRFVSL